MRSFHNSPSRHRQVLSIQSHVVHGHVGNKAAVFPLQVLGFEVDFINSVQFSNHTKYPIFSGQVVTGDEVTELVRGLDENELLTYSHILTGYIGSPSFLANLQDVISRCKARNTSLVYVCDPVLGDDGKFYVPPEMVELFRTQLLPLAQITTPNQFEIEALTGLTVRTHEDAQEAVRAIHAMGPDLVVLSSYEVEGDASGKLYAMQSRRSLAEGVEEHFEMTRVSFPKLEATGTTGFTGTGDTFASLFLAHSQMQREFDSGEEGDGDDGPTVLEGSPLLRALATMHSILQKTMQHQSYELSLIPSLNAILEPPIAAVREGSDESDWTEETV